MSGPTQAQREEAKRQAEIYDQDEKYMLAVVMWRDACNEDGGTWPLEDTLIAWLVDRLTDVEGPVTTGAMLDNRVNAIVAARQKDIEAATIKQCAEELEKAYAECSTLNLLHGAARLRAMKDKL